jgi:3-oxoacyl-[acyl-carrier protein] reductase
MKETASVQGDSVVLQDQIAVVTGSARGIGEAVARKLARMGATVVLTARDAARLAEVKAAIENEGGHAAVLPCDLTGEKAVTAFCETVLRQYGRCDILVNNAAIGVAGKPLHELAPEEWTRVIDTNLRAPYLTIRAFAPAMIAARRGHIVNISSLAGKNPLPNGAAYAASKWGLNGLTYSVAEELRAFGVRVSVVAPGSVDTSFGSGRPPGQGKDRSKMVQPEDVAHVIATIVTQAPNSFISEVLLRPTMKP